MKALETNYRGIGFRSRTEARWAAFFDGCGIEWNYEPEGFDLKAGWYLPDFYLPDLDLWFEVKPDETDLSERAVFEELCASSGMNGIIAYGPPVCGRLSLDYFDGQWTGPYTLLEDRRDSAVFWLAAPGEWFALPGDAPQSDHDRLPILTLKLKAAYESAAAHRFGVHA